MSVDIIVSVFNILTFVWMALWAVFVTALALSGIRFSISIPIIALFIFNGLPLLFDELIGQPNYYNKPGFQLATTDASTAIVYCIYMVLIPPFLWLVGKPQKLKTAVSRNDAPEPHQNRVVEEHVPPVVYAVLLAILISPIIALLLSPEPSAYLQYGWREWQNRRYLSREVVSYGVWLSRFGLLSIVSSAVLLYVMPKIRYTLVIALLGIVFFDVIIISMRHPVAYAAVLWIVVLWQKGYLKGISLTIMVTLMLIGFILFTNYFLSEYRGRGYRETTFEEFYTAARIDYGRDDVVKLTLFAELNPGRMQILEHRGQSVLYTSLIFIPRAIWTNKPLSYADYVTSAMRGIPPQPLYTHMTTSWLEEAIANFSWFGMILGPLVPALICRVGDTKARSPIVRTLSFFTASLFLAVHLPAFYPIFGLWLVTLFIDIRPSIIRMTYKIS